MLKGIRGFTLIELVIVMVILGILAAIAMPKFIDLIEDANKAATQAGLGAIRSLVALKYSRNVARGTTGDAAYDFTITATDFFDGKMPVNKAVGTSAITYLSAVPTDTSSSIGWWYVTSGDAKGRAGAYVKTTTEPYNDFADW